MWDCPLKGGVCAEAAAAAATATNATFKENIVTEVKLEELVKLDETNVADPVFIRHPVYLRIAFEICLHLSELRLCPVSASCLGTGLCLRIGPLSTSTSNQIPFSDSDTVFCNVRHDMRSIADKYSHVDCKYA